MTKRILGFLARVLLLLVGLVAALWVFMPWREVGAAALSLGAPELERRGLRLSFSDVEGGDGGFTVNGLLVGGMVSLTFDSVTLRPQLLTSLANLAPACEVRFRGGSMTMGQTLSFGNGSFLLIAGKAASPREVLLEQLRTDGDFALQGFLTVDPAQMRIGRAEVSVKVPASFEGNMNTLRNFLPLVKDRNGGWFLRRGNEGA